MAQLVQVVPRAYIEGSAWIVSTTINGVSTSHDVVSSVAAPQRLGLLKIAFRLEIGDADTHQDVDDALFLDDIKPGGGVETVWGNWLLQAEAKIAALLPGVDPDSFWAAWTKGDTAAVRSDARRALVTQRGWTVFDVHQHEGDGTVTSE